MASDTGTSPPERPRLADIAGGRFAGLLSRWSDAGFLAHDFFHAGAAPPEGVAAENLPVLRAYHRLLRAYPDPAAADVLYGRGFHSAHQVAAVPQHRFVREQAQALGGEEVARAAHRGARGARARARLVGAAVRDLAGSAHFRATRFYNGSPETVSYYTDVPSYQDFFGGVYYQTCPDCASVLGPAAYFLDLMRIADFYVGDPNQGTIPPGWGLEERRPDLFDSLLLDCESSTATQPVLVIVNEILQAHLQAALAVDDLWRDVFPAARYPFNQPFALPLAQLRATLPQLRTTLAEVWADYGAAEDAVARESLQLSFEQKRDLVTPHLTPEALWPFYGWDDAADHLAQLAQLETFLQRTALARPQLVSLLQQETDGEEFAAVAPTFFINDTGETVPGTVDPLPPLQLVLDTTDPDAPVERIENLTLPRADRLMRFIRLQSQLGWSYASLDWGMKAVADPADDADAIAQSFDALALVQRLRSRLGVEPDVLAGLWYPVKPIGRVSAEHPRDLFDRTFNSPVLLAGRDPYARSAVDVPFDPARPIAWNPAGTARLDLEVRSRLTAALGVTDNDLTAVAAYLNCLRGAAADAPIDTTLENLSSLFRLTRLPQALGLAVGAYLTMLRAMYGPDQTCADRPAGAPRLTPLNVAAQAEVAAWLALSGWTPYDLQYAITGVANPKVDSDFDSAAVRPFVDSLATAAEPSRLTQESFVFEDVDAQESARVSDGLVAAGALTPAGVLRTAVGTGGAGVGWEQLAALLPVTPDTFLLGQLPPTGVPDPTAVTVAEAQETVVLLLEHGVLLPIAGVPEGTAGALAQDFTATTDLSYLFPDEEDEAAAQHKRDEVRDDLLQVQRDVEHSLGVLDEAWRVQDASAVGGVAQFFGVDGEMAAVLVPFAAPLAGVDEVLADLLTPFPSDPLPTAESERLARTEELFRLLARLLFVLEKLDYTAEEAAGVVDDPAAFGVPGGDLDVAAVQSMWSFKALTAAFRDRDGELLDYLLMPDATEAEVTAKLAKLSALTGWPEPQIATLVGTLWPAGSDGYGTVFGVARLKRAFDRSAATGANVDTLLAVEALSGLPLAADGATDPAAWTAYRNAAGSVLDLVNARYRGSELDRVNETIQDTLVTQRRNVLLPYALWTLSPALLPGDTAGALPTPEDVYEYLLIDVQSSNCDRVSRIAQGVASVQLYLQRARLNLEPGVEQIPVPEVWWEWLASYGTWGANRRIFLYPENYVDPSLRRSATPVYRQLQEALLQAEVGDASVEAAYRDYLDGFATAAQLRIVGVYRNLQTDPQTGEVLDDTLFQLGRTAAQPYVYYHRSLRYYAVEQDPASPGTGRTAGAWSAWVKVGVTIPVEHVTPVYAFGRLMVFWVEQQVTSGSYVQDQASQDYEVTRASIHYSFLNFRGEWAAPQTLADGIVASVEPNDYPEKLGVDPVLFDPRQLWWREVAVLVVPPDRYATDAPFDNQEQLLVIYGPWLAYSPGDAITAPEPPTPPWEEPVPARYALNREIYFAQEARWLMANSLTGSPGLVPVKPVLAVAFTGIVQAQTAVVLDSLPPYPSDWPVPYSGGLEGRTLVVQEYPSQIAVEYGDEVVENAWPAASSAGATRAAQAAAPPAAAGAPEAAQATLLVNLAAVNTATTAVKNQPGWFVFDNGDDVFLAVSQQEPLYSVSARFQASDLAVYGLPPWYMYLWTYPYTAAQAPLASQVFAFTRLGTHTVDELSRLLFAGGVDALLTPAAQEAKELPFGRFYPPAGQPASVIDTTTATLDFDGAYGPYFWEVFFYTVFLAAERLSGDRRFAEAKRWYEYLFDPTAEGGSTDPDLYWRFLPFRSQTPEALEDSLTSVAQIAAYNDDPFDPDAIARLRPGAYPRAMVLRYVQNLIDWGDALFTQDTREAVTQATLLYVLAGDLLGKPPVNLGTFRIPDPKTYAEIVAAYDTAGTAQGSTAETLVLEETAEARDAFYDGLTLQITGGAGSGQARTVVAYVGATRTATVSTPWSTPAPAAGSTYQVLGIPQFLIEVENAPAAVENAAGLAPQDVPFVDADPYFCVPENQELTALWETIADRLFKIRHCMNIRGVERQLAQFEPPLDPRALMAGGGAGGAPPVQQGAGTAIPFYRFAVMLEQARALAAATAQLGGSLLGALQSLDAEELSLLSVTQQQAVLSLTTRVYEDQAEAARWQVRVVVEGQAGAQERLDYYTALLAVGLSPTELANLAAMEAGLVMNILAGTTRALASVAYAVPQVGSPFAITYGGQQVGAALTAAAGVFDIGSTVAAYVAQRTATRAGYQRRAQEWELQQTLAGQDLASAGDSLEAARLQVRIAERNLEVHRRTLAQSEETEAFLRRKFTSRELYQWLSSRLSSLHFQTFSLAYGTALSAQQAYQYELDSSQTFVNFGYWSAPQRGLLAGEGLLLALNQMEAAYLAGTPRALEIERTVSLLQANPRALLELRETGECAFELSERLFDQDFPGHYARKIRTISVSIPAVVGPYQNVKATLTQTSNQVVMGPYPDAVRYLLGADGGAAGPQAPPPAGRLRSNWWNRQAIALSSGVNDDGMFVLNFQDPRYLPFEGTGAVSTWRLSMPRAANRFDYEALSDVVIRVSYTARDGGEAFRQAVTAIPQVKEYAAARYFDLAQQYPDAWYAFLRDHTNPAAQSLSFAIAALAPPQVEDVTPSHAFVQLQVAGDADAEGTYLALAQPGGTPQAVPVGPGNHSATEPLASTAYAGSWTLAFDLEDAPPSLTTDGFLDPAKLLDVQLIVYYGGELDWGPT